MGPVQQSWVARAWELRGKVSTGARAQVKRKYTQMKHRYGPRYTKVLLLAAFVGLFSPVPGSTVVAVLLVVAIAEAHRSIIRRGGFAEVIAELAMVIKKNMPFWVPGRSPLSSF